MALLQTLHPADNRHLHQPNKVQRRQTRRQMQLRQMGKEPTHPLQELHRARLAHPVVPAHPALPGLAERPVQEARLEAVRVRAPAATLKLVLPIMEPVSAIMAALAMPAAATQVRLPFAVQVQVHRPQEEPIAEAPTL